MVAANQARGFDADVVRTIQGRLDAILRDDRVAIPFAVESGSRAWGFPSPDSDYDCRFVFVRARDDYLTPWPRRDVIETPLDALLDVSGWELGKFVKLMLKGNAVAIEWLQSPIRYRDDEDFRAALLDLADRYAARDAIRRHYLHLGEGQWRRFSGETAPGKKLFYVLRPAAALRWLRLHSDARVAPMDFPTLLAQAEPPADLTETVARLIKAKATTRELGTIETPAPVRAFVEAEFAEARRSLEDAPSTRLSSMAKAAAETTFRALLSRYAPA